MGGYEQSRLLRQRETWAEKLMWRWLRNRRFTAYKFRRQHPIGKYRLDFYCMEARLNIELDGSQHGFPDQRRHDQIRTDFLSAHGIKTLRFWNHALNSHPQAVRDRIFTELQALVPHPLPAYTRPLPSASAVK